ncbi:MAG TPA: DNA polymerase IV, partial [Stellaceae bacterium]|nr:DNA polymerase IV [Stellaceae bacterium]
RSQAHPVGDHATLEQMARELLIPIFPTEKGIRLLGLSLSSLGEDEEDGDQDEAEQLPLF